VLVHTVCAEWSEEQAEVLDHTAYLLAQSLALYYRITESN